MKLAFIHFCHGYISERKQKGLVNGEHAKSSRVLSGVSQGSILGPLLFLSTLKVSLSYLSRNVQELLSMLMTCWYRVMLY